MGTMAHDVKPADRISTPRTSVDARVSDVPVPGAPDPAAPSVHAVELPEAAVVGGVLADGIGAAVTSRLPRRSTLVRRVLIATDTATLGVCTIAALALADPDGRIGGQVLWALSYCIVLLALFRLYGLYERDSKRLGHSTLDDVPQVFHALLIGTIGLWAYLQLVPAERPVLSQAALF